MVDSGPRGSSCSGSPVPLATESHLTNDLCSDSSSSEPPAKRPRIEENTKACFFQHTKFSSITDEAVAELIKIFTEKFPALSRSTLASLPDSTRTPIQNSFIVLQVYSSRCLSSFMQRKRVRLLCREILPDGTRGCSNQLNLSDCVPTLMDGLPKELKAKTDWMDLKTQPVVIASGFTKETDKFINPQWNSNLVCEVESVPRILIATVPIVPIVPKPVEALFVPDIPVTPRIKPAVPATPNLGYTLLKDLVPGQTRYNVLAIVKNYFHPRSVNNGRSLMQTFHIVDPSLDINNDERLLCFAYQTLQERLPPVRKMGDVIVIHGLQVILFHDQKQGRMYADSTRATVVDGQSLDAREPTGVTLSVADFAAITQLRDWFNDSAPVLSAAEAKWKADSEKRATEKNLLAASRTELVPQAGDLSGQSDIAEPVKEDSAKSSTIVLADVAVPAQSEKGDQDDPPVAAVMPETVKTSNGTTTASHSPRKGSMVFVKRPPAPKDTSPNSRFCRMS